MSELKPCPFCGGEVQIEPSDFCFNVSLNVTESVIYCPTCDEVFGERHNKSKLHLVEWWDTRAERTCQMKKARWDDGQCTWGVICSACGHKHEHEFEYSFNFCPTCGAKVVAP